jgi:diaminohydroxyphosphoribosylaminopyrimidine deaminase/5-amino-6-(5-phosphoribosylamino)uracil reductase
MNDTAVMRKVLLLAKKGKGRVNPNPLVGAILVRNDQIVSRGYHAFFGGPHAEADALLKISTEEAQGCTLYVNLEPCDHFGKTPPCTESIIRHRVRKVVVGTKDPNPLVSGRGIDRLKKAGISVDVGILEKECLKLNGPYFKYMIEKEPFVTVKIAQTLDGMIALPDGQSKWISCEESRKCVQQLRLEADAVVVGVNTIIKDDPSLTVHQRTKHVLKRIILDSKLRTPIKSKVLRKPNIENTILATTGNAEKTKVQKLVDHGAMVWILPENKDGMVDLRSLLKKIAKENMISILVEGGSNVFSSFIKQRLCDNLIVFIAPKIFGKGIKSFGNLEVDNIQSAISLEYVKYAKSGTDVVAFVKLT